MLVAFWERLFKGFLHELLYLTGISLIAFIKWVLLLYLSWISFNILFLSLRTGPYENKVLLLLSINW